MMLFVLLLILLESASSEILGNTKLQKQLYERNFNTSIQLDKEGKDLLGTWTVDFQVKRVNFTTGYRMQMTKHKEHSFRKTDDNAKWTECMFLHHKQIRKSEKQYYADECECLTTTTAEDKHRTKTVDQVEKEIRKWRRSYRYLVNTCNTEHPGDEEASVLCLIEYMEKDNYGKVIQRLMILKVDAMKELSIQLDNSLNHFEVCLKTKLSIYLEKVRIIMETLNTCYSMTTQSVEKETEYKQML